MLIKMFVYCKRCGLITKQKQAHDICPACEIPMDVVPSTYLTTSGMMFASQALRKEFEESIKENEEFDPQASLERDSIISKKEIEHKAEIEGKVAEYNQNRIKFTCPICHSENISKISNVGKIVKVGALGILGAGDIGKKYRCNSCGYRY